MMIPKEQIEIEILKNLSHASDMLSYDARVLKQSLFDKNSDISLVLKLQRSLESLRLTLDVVQEQMVTLKLLDKV